MPSIKNQFLHISLYPTETPNVLNISLYPTETPNVLKKKGKGTECINLVREHRNKVCVCVKYTHTHNSPQLHNFTHTSQQFNTFHNLIHFIIHTNTSYACVTYLYFT